MASQHREKKVPVRRCVGCGEGREKKDLVRVVRNKAGEVSLDLTGKAPGRGAYLCRDAACLAKAQKKRSLQRAFGAEVPKDVYEALEKQLGEAHD